MKSKLLYPTSEGKIETNEHCDGEGAEPTRIYYEGERPFTHREDKSKIEKKIYHRKQRSKQKKNRLHKKKKKEQNDRKDNAIEPKTVNHEQQ